MSKAFFLTGIFLFFTFNFVLAQNAFHAIISDSLTGEKLPGATVRIQNTTMGSVSDVNGVVEIKNIPDGSQIFVISFIGYKTKTFTHTFPSISNASFNLLLSRNDEEIEGVYISSNRLNSRIEDAPIKVEVLGSDEMNEENSIKPGNVTSLLGDVSSIQIQQTSAVTGSSVVRMQGLDGKYTLLLRDGFPSYGGLSGGFSILQIPPLDLKQIELIKGPASTMYGGGAIAGLINFISKLPSDSAEAAITLNYSTLTEKNLNAYFSGTKKKMGYTCMGAYTTQNAVDVDKDNFSDVPAVNSFLLHPQFFYTFNKKTNLRLGITTTAENRNGGDMHAIRGNFDSLHSYFNKTFTVRNAADVLFTHTSAKNNKLSFKSCINQFTREETKATSSFNGEQLNLFSELFYSIPFKNQNLIFGTNYLTDNFTNHSQDSIMAGSYSNYTAGFFTQYSLKYKNILNLEAGVRADYHSTYGWFILPSLAALVHAGKSLSFRLNAGSGYKSPDLLELSESSNNEGLPLLFPGIHAERSMGGTAEWNYNRTFKNGMILFFNQTFFYTQIENAVSYHAQADGSVLYYNTNWTITTRGIDNYVRITKDAWELYFGYTYTEPVKDDGSKSWLKYTPLNRSGMTLMYAFSEAWEAGIEAAYNGIQYLDDGSKSRDYYFIAASVHYNVGAFTFVLNGENLLDFRQTNYEDIITGSPSHPVFSTLWAPIDGRVINLSVRVKI